MIDRMAHDGGELWLSGDTFLFVPTQPPSRRYRTLKPLKTIEKQSADKEIFFRDVVHDFYPKRPDHLSGLSLNEFVKKYKQN